MLNAASILVISCDAYKDVWPVFFKFFHKNWPDCPYSVYLQTNFADFYCETIPIKVLKCGKDEGWSSNLIQSLKRINTSRVLCLLDDFLLWQLVKTERIRELENCMQETGAVYVRLVSKPYPQEPLPGWPGVGIIHKGAAYRFSSQASFWDRDVLINLLKPGESIWDAEIRGSGRSDQLERLFLSVNLEDHSEWPIRYLNSVLKRKWTPEALIYAKNNNITLNLNSRSVCNRYDQLRRSDFFSYCIGRIAFFSKKLLGERLYTNLKNRSFIRWIVY